MLTLGATLSLAATSTVREVAAGQPPHRVVAPSTGVLITFEEAAAHPDGDAPTVLTDQYADRGVRFTESVTTLVLDAATNPAAAGFAHSDPTVLTSCYAQEFCTNIFRLEFADPVTAAGVWVGSRSSSLPAAAVVMTALDARGKPVTAASTVLGPSEVPVPVETWLETTDAAGRIQGLRISWEDPTLGLSSLTLDDLAFTPFVPLTEVTAVPSSLELDTEVPAGEVRFENTGNVEIAIGGATVTAAFTTDDNACAGPLPVGESCVVSVEFAPEEGGPDEVSGTLTLLGRSGDSVAAVALQGTVLGIEGESESAPGSTSPPTSPPTGPGTDGQETDAPANEEVAPASGALRWGLGLLTVVVAVALVAAIGAWVRPTSIPKHATVTDPPRLHTRVDPGVQRIRSRGPVVGLHGRWDLTAGSTTIHEGRHP